MAQVFTIHRGDRLPNFAATLADADGNAPDLDTATEVRFQLRSTRDGTTKVDGAATGDGAVATYEWAAGDTDTPGRYWAEIHVTWPGELPQTFPNDTPIVVHIT